MEEDCPVCGKTCDSQGLENHIRLTDGRGHGPAGSMPADPSGPDDDPPKRSVSIHAEDIQANGPDKETMSVQAALDRVIETRNDEVSQLTNLVTSLEDRIEGLEGIVDSIHDRLTVECPECGMYDPEPMVGEVAEAHAEYIGVYEWVCPNCQHLFNDL